MSEPRGTVASVPPPRRPARARRRTGLVSLALVFAVYVGGYVDARTQPRRMVVNPWLSMGGQVSYHVIDPDPRAASVFTWRTTFFRPCIAVEEWWLNR